MRRLFRQPGAARARDRLPAPVLITAIPSLNAILQATEAHARTITKVSTGLALADVIVESFARNFAYSPVLFQIRRSVKDTMLKSQEDLILPLSEAVDTPEQYCAAHYAVQRYASYCSISSIQALVQAALVNAKVDETPASREATRRAGAGAGGAALVRAHAAGAARTVRSAAPRAIAPLPRAPNFTVRPN
jgi:hypothetical protein